MKSWKNFNFQKLIEKGQYPGSGRGRREREAVAGGGSGRRERERVEYIDFIGAGAGGVKVWTRLYSIPKSKLFIFLLWRLKKKMEKEKKRPRGIIFNPPVTSL